MMHNQHLIQRATIGLAAFFLVMCFFALAAIRVELEARYSIANSRSPIYVSQEEEASFAYRVDNTFIDSRLVGVLELEPLSDSTALPAGLRQWLEPGQIAVSKAAEQYAEILERQFGPIQAVIDDAVILDNEIIVYYRPSNGHDFIELARDNEGVYFASGFANADTDGALFGNVDYEQWSQFLLPVVLLLFAFPLVLNLRATRASVGEVLAGERFILQCIGAPRRELIRHSVTYLYRPYLLGVSVAVILIVVVATGYVSLPMTGFRLHPDLYIDRLAFFIGYLALVAGTGFAYLAWPRTRQARHNSGKRWSIGTRTGLLLFGLGILVAAVVGLLWAKVPNSLILPLILITVFLVLLGLHSALAVLCRLVTICVIKIRSRDLRAGVFFRWVIHHPYKASRTGAFAGSFVAVGVILVAIFGIISGAQVPPQSHPDNIQIVKTSLNCPEGSATCLNNAAEAMRSHDPTAAVFVAAYGQGVMTVSVGHVDQPYLRQFVDHELVPEYGAEVDEISLDSRWASIYTVSDRESDLLAQVQEVDFGTAIKALSIVDGEDGRAIAQIYRQQASWLMLFTVLGFIYAMTSVWLQYARDTSGHAKEFSSIASLTGKADMIARSITWRNTLVDVVTGAASLSVGIFLARQFLFPFGGFFPWAFIISVGSIYLAFILTQAILMYVLVKKEASSWLPGKS